MFYLHKFSFKSLLVNSSATVSCITRQSAMTDPRSPRRTFNVVAFFDDCFVLSRNGEESFNKFWIQIILEEDRATGMLVLVDPDHLRGGPSHWDVSSCGSRSS